MIKNGLIVASSILVLCVVGGFSADPWTSLGNLACRHDDSKCMKESAKKLLPYFVEGIPEYGVEKSNPLFIKHIDSSSRTLKFILKDVTVKGLQDCHIRKIERNFEKSTVGVKVTCSSQVSGHYTMKGQFSILPIEGDGKLRVQLKNVRINVLLHIEDIIGKDGKTHWNIKNWSHTFDLREPSQLDFENLYNGNEGLARAARSLISNSANDILKEIGTPVFTAINKSIVDNVNNMFHAIPAEALSIDN